MRQRQTAFENIVGKEEIARNEQFPLFPQCFLLNQKILSPFVNMVNPLPGDKILDWSKLKQIADDILECI